MLSGNIEPKVVDIKKRHGYVKNWRVFKIYVRMFVAHKRRQTNAGDKKTKLRLASRRNYDLKSWREPGPYLFRQEKKVRKLFMIFFFRQNEVQMINLTF